MPIGQTKTKLQHNTNKSTNKLTNESFESLNINKQIPFIKVPNHIITYSIKHNRTILPSYLYGMIHAEVYNEYYCSLNLSFLLSYYVSPTKRKRMSNQFVKGLNILLYGNSNSKNENEKNENKDNETLENSFQLKYERDKNLDFTTNEIITFKVIDREVNIVNRWTGVYFDEYYYLVNEVNERNYGVSGKNEWNLIDLINLYLYLKMKINQNDNMSNIRSASIPYIYSFESFSKMYKNGKSNNDNDNNLNVTGIGSKTITKYLNQLQELGLIKILSEKQYNKLKEATNKSRINNQWMMQGDYGLMSSIGYSQIDKALGEIEKIKYGYNSREKKHVIELSEEWRNK